MTKISMFDKFAIGKIQIKNRLVSSSIFERVANNGHISSAIIEYYRHLAEGGVGLVITGMEAISEGAVNGPAMIKTTYDGYIEDLKKLVDIMHANDTKIFVQLQHTGYKTAWQQGCDTFGPSPYKVTEACTYHEATAEELEKLVHDFGQAALRCQQAGCDGVEIHAVHGYLLNTFLSPYFNHRTDEYGGSIANRARLLLAVYDEVRKQVGKDFCVGVKFPCSDLVTPSITPEETVWACQELEKRGIDMIEVSAGIDRNGGPSSFAPFARTGKKEGKFSEGAELIASHVHVPVLSVGGYRSPQFIEDILNTTHITAISLGRPLISEPNLINRWQTDPTAARCISCNGCFTTPNIASCVLNKKQS